jgi:hypothetical protein
MLHDLAKTCEHTNSPRRAHRAGPNTQLTTVPRLDPQALRVPPVGWPQPNALGRSPGSLTSRPSLSRLDVLRTVREGLRPFNRVGSRQPEHFPVLDRASSDAHRTSSTFTEPSGSTGRFGAHRRPQSTHRASAQSHDLQTRRTSVPRFAHCYAPPSVLDAHRNPCGSTESPRRLTEPPFPCVAAPQR